MEGEIPRMICCGKSVAYTLMQYKKIFHNHINNKKGEIKYDDKRIKEFG
jgi:hypothetical protein